MSESKMIQNKRFEFVLGGLLLLITVGYGLIRVVTAVAAPFESTITVCQPGPPTCDYASIQQGLNAAVAGDTVNVLAGTYPERIILPSGITLMGVDGAENTLITASVGPIVSASDLNATVMAGFTINGSQAMTTAVGIKAVDSVLSLDDIIIQNLNGRDGIEGQPDGTPVTGIQISGTTTLTLTTSIIQNLRGGNGLDGLEGGAAGGEAAAIWAERAGTLTMTELTITHITGGDAGSENLWPYSCEGVGGRAVGVHASDEIDLTIEKSNFLSLHGGKPCIAGAWGCVYYAGAVVGVEAIGGRVILRDNLFSALYVIPAHFSDPARAIHTSSTQGTILERNSIEAINFQIFDSFLGFRTFRSPFCSPPDVKAVAIASEIDASLHAFFNHLHHIRGRGPGGEVTALQVNEVPEVAITDNTIQNIYGGSYETTSGIEVNAPRNVLIESNVLGKMIGEDAPDQVYFNWGVPGGDVVGIIVIDPVKARVSNNIVYSLTAGHGSDMEPENTGPPGGSVIAVYISGDEVEVINNTIHQSSGGRGGWPDGRDGTSTGLLLENNGRFIILNNIISEHQLGVQSYSPGNWLFDFNDVWNNETDYQNVTPGLHVLNEPPGYIGAEIGNFHLSATSPLVDAGSNIVGTVRDFEGQPRPVAGNDSAAAVVDIGADEYWPPGLTGSSKTVSQWRAEPGDVLFYELTLANYNPTEEVAFVHLIDRIREGATFLEGSLSASEGTAVYNNGAIRWNGWVPALHEVIVTYAVTVNDPPTTPFVILNLASLEDQVRPVVILQTITYIDPYLVHFPVVFN